MQKFLHAISTVYSKVGQGICTAFLEFQLYYRLLIREVQGLRQPDTAQSYLQPWHCRVTTWAACFICSSAHNYFQNNSSLHITGTQPFVTSVRSLCPVLRVLQVSEAEILYALHTLANFTLRCEKFLLFGKQSVKHFSPHCLLVRCTA